MEQSFVKLLGLDLETALGELQSAGLADVRVTYTAAPPRKNPAPEEALRSVEGERRGDASTRVVDAREGGRTLIVSRFLTGSPLNRQMRAVNAAGDRDTGRMADEP